MSLENPARSPLLKADWKYVEKPALEDYRADDWARLTHQRAIYFAEQQAVQAVRMLRALHDEPTYGYEINNYQHCLQSATMAMRDGHDEETIVVALFHDIGFVVCPETHGAFAAALMASYVSEANHWMLRHHAIFQQKHFHEYPGKVDPDERDRWRGHAHFAWTVEFVDKYDQNAIQLNYDTAPIEAFEPMVQRFFARPPRSVALD